MQTAPQTPSQSFIGTSSVIKTFVRLREVTGGVACLSYGRRNFTYRGILKINTVNFGLMSEEDQDALIEGFKAFLNGLSFPIQILIRNLPYRLDEYLKSMESVEGDLAEMARDHADFVRQLASKRALVKRAFYIIIPADTAMIKNRTEALINAQTQLKLRSDELMRQLERLGLTGQRLSDKEIIALYHSCFTSEEGWSLPMTDGLIDGVNRLMVSARDHSEPAQEARYVGSLEEQDEEEQSAKGKAKKKRAASKEQIPNLSSIPELICEDTGLHKLSAQRLPWLVRCYRADR